MLFRRLIAKAAQELANNPEARAKAKKVYDDEVKPRAAKFYKEHETEISSAKDSAIRGAAKLALKVKKKFKEV